MFYAEDLDQMKCAAPGCTHENHEYEPMVWHAVCHPRSATFTWYDPVTQSLTIRCAACERQVATIKVASKS